MIVDLECEAVLFDLDGVLVDSLGVAERILRDWAAEHGVDGDHAVALSHGRRDVDLIALLAPDLDVAAEVAWIVDREERAVDGITAMPGALDLLAAVPPGRWAVVTSGARAVARARMGAARLPEPAHLVAAEDVRRGKPDPEPYLRGARLLGVAAERCVVIEDAMSGVRAALAAGMRCVGVGAEVVPSAVTLHVANLNELSAVVDGGVISLSATAASSRSTRRSGAPHAG
ncbi:HAD-IA family hydrolase [Planosporangium mesophilum]|uniref:Haloacid dehalogenase n=1 Tax=Planosporangium mesophilum TaxID=689768 RepID=A0A8J3TI29_9ACTN|nr:HAD-IA family hydrolase [Planosporangium mesophilum]NJC85795.1 HAD-IA family hydrolase [Planosporangium mesophilum]GII21855.1 haloacid dehalogenase [Planosporangium mesophilum]